MQSNTYPQQSYNNSARCQQRWNDDARTNLNDDGWQISIKNGKRLNRHWTRAQGFYIVNTSYGERTIYNEDYDADLNTAMEEHDLSGGYDSIPYHVGMDY
jgi:hypothetical protein